MSMVIRRSAGATARAGGAGAILLALALGPAGALGQWGDVRIEVGGSRAFAPSGTDLAAATYITAGLQVDRGRPRKWVFRGHLRRDGHKRDRGGLGELRPWRRGGGRCRWTGGVQPVDIHIGVFGRWAVSL